MLVNRANLDILFTGYSAAFRSGVAQGEAKSQWSTVATEVPSTTKKNLYPWLGKIAGLRKWIGDRQIQNLVAHKFEIENDDYEDTVGVDRNDIEDDTYGVYSSYMTMMGQAVAAHPDQLIWPLLKSGFTTACYDGQYFFDADHPVIAADGASTVSVANTDGGSGTPWFLFDSKWPMKPLILQERKKPDFVAMDQPNDEQVFNTRQFRYGVHARRNAGFGFWQTIWGSKQPLNTTNYNAAYAALVDMKGDHGRPVGLMPDTLVVPGALRTEGLEIVNAERLSSGATNVNRGTANLVIVPWLA